MPGEDQGRPALRGHPRRTRGQDHPSAQEAALPEKQHVRPGHRGQAQGS